ncbi:LacI family DNA-binding transcriptional regulator [Pseudonocardia sp. MH-G8]|uniref:LacI family DNA-binding transcriptional regulator n=1 Tax=Pseudonocardia sp. MH-G8 TaxID=1854588 RepID=UPI000BA0EBF9|nr:LacI family DNA-binding transcriptional regulator [Pseudonocardia sp. MH-G8]OZM75915.1 LacI family transcriptional regulator [Pseudonocardia sp. MH-G8]
MAGGKARPTLREVAAAAGVSVATCSYVLSGRSDRVRQLPQDTQDKVREAARRLGYAGNTAARVLRRQRTELIALVYAPPVGPWLDRLTMQCEDVAVAHGYSVIGLPIRHAERAEHSLRVITQGYVDGVIFAPGLADGLDLDRFARSTRAIVAFSDYLEPGPADLVRNQVRAAMGEAVEHLLKIGHRRIGYLAHTGRPADAGTRDRYLGYQDALERAGVPIDPALARPGAASREEALVGARELLDAADPPTALISESDRGAIAALQVARERGLAVPDDFAVIGVGNTQEAVVSFPALTSVGMAQFDFTEIVEVLFARIDEPDRPPRVLDLPWVLDRRASA